MRIRRALTSVLTLAIMLVVSHPLRAADWKAGVATTVITPQQSMWMAGYAARDKPSEGKIHDLKAKALALQDASDTRLVIVTVDLIGIPRDLRSAVEAQAHQQLRPAAREPADQCLAHPLRPRTAH